MQLFAPLAAVVIEELAARLSTKALAAAEDVDDGSEQEVFQATPPADEVNNVPFTFDDFRKVCDDILQELRPAQTTVTVEKTKKKNRGARSGEPLSPPTLIKKKADNFVKFRDA